MDNNNALLNLEQFYPKNLEILSVKEESTKICISMRSRSKLYYCPKCNTELHQLHATHRRKVQDLPILGKCVMLNINVHEFICNNDNCTVGIITETFNGFLNYYSRMTERLADFVTTIAMESSCEGTAKILKMLHVKISGDTIIRLLLKRYSFQPEPISGSVIGVDDFAFKKRNTYGTIIVDETTHKPIAILDGRDGSTLKKWLKNNNHVTTITRDRASAYAKSIEEILPDCMQIADRFHLHQNLLDVIKRILNREIPTTVSITKKEEVIVEEATNTVVSDETITNILSDPETNRLQLIYEIQQRYESGTSISELARHFKKSRNTIKKYIKGDPIILCRSHKKGCLDSYKDFIIKCIQQGLIPSRIAELLKEQGYTKSANNARQYVTKIAKEHSLELNKYCNPSISTITPLDKSKKDYVTRKEIFKYLWMEGELSKNHHEYLWKEYPALQELECCIRHFREIFDKKNMPLLYIFIENYKKSTYNELMNFILGLERDLSAVENAVASDLSNGFVEGFNNKLKTIKRTMYGRCGRELLAAKLMYCPNG